MPIPYKSYLPQEVVNKAISLAQEVYKTPVVKGKANYAGSYSKKRYEIGFTGQYHFCNLLEKKNKRYEHKPKASGKSEPDDVIVFINGQRMRVEIKTSGDPSHKYCAMPKKQKLDANALVGVRLGAEWTEADIFGYLPKRLFSKVKELFLPNTKNMKGISYHELEDMNDMLAKMDDKTEEGGA